jgi:hypothetical protein
MRLGKKYPTLMMSFPARTICGCMLSCPTTIGHTHKFTKNS